MKKIRRVLAVIVFCCLFILIEGGCSQMTNQTSNQTTSHNAQNKILTDRQIQILQEEGLPTVFDQLTISQQRAIQAIEEMLKAIEQKYGEDFAYVGYMPKSPIEAEKLVAVPIAGDPVLDQFSVYREQTDTGFSFRDTYAHIKARNAVCLALSQDIQNVWGKNVLKAYCAVVDLKQEPDRVTLETLRGNVDAIFWIFVDDSHMSEEDFRSLPEWFRSWADKSGIAASGTLFLTENAVFASVSAVNYTDHMSPSDVVLSLTF